MNELTQVQYALDTFYFLVCGALVMWMAAGFSMLEAGLVRAKNTTEILTKNVALRWATEGVRVNSIHPGFIATPILEQSRNTPIWDGMTSLTPMGRLGRPDDIAAGVAYLASDDAAFVTGLELYIDGGYMAR